MVHSNITQAARRASVSDEEIEEPAQIISRKVRIYLGARWHQQRSCIAIRISSNFSSKRQTPLMEPTRSVIDLSWTVLDLSAE